jgi:ribonuclease HI
MEPISHLKKITLFISAACTTDRVGSGGWACRLQFGDVVSEMFGCDAKTTVNRMAIRAATEGLRAIKQRCCVDVHTSSDYVYNGMRNWLPKWKTNGWQTESGEVKNQELWKELGEAAAQHVVRWWLVKADSPDAAEHQFCDKLASEAAAQQISSPLTRKLPERVGEPKTADIIPSTVADEKVAV